MSLRITRVLITSLCLLFALTSVAAAQNLQVVAGNYKIDGDFGLGERFQGFDNLTYVIDKTPTKEKAYKFGFTVKARTRFGRTDNTGQRITIFRAIQAGVPKLFSPKKARIEVHLERRNPNSKLADRLVVWVYEKNQTRTIDLGRIEKAGSQLTVCWTAKTNLVNGTVIIELDGVEVFNESDFKTKKWKIDTVALGNLGSDNLGDVRRWVAIDTFFSSKIII